MASNDSDASYQSKVNSQSSEGEERELKDSEVKLGTVFDVVEPTDFRLSIEGASGTGKSNSLAVLMEDLADCPIPMLMIEDLSILTPIKKFDNNIIVVGGKDSEGIDIPVSIDHLGHVARMVIEEGMKVILDVGTFRDSSVDDSMKHLAAAKVIEEINQLAEERLRTGSRRKVLVAIDEAHILAPENTSDVVTVTESVKKCRTEMIEMATRGGNKGINMIVAYQRRSALKKGVLSQVDNYVFHRLEASDRQRVTSNYPTITEENITDLSEGEVYVYGDITDQQMIGPRRVRRRQSPDPREGTFEMPELSSSSSEVIEKFEEEIGSLDDKEAKKQSRIEELEEQVEKLKERNRRLRDKADISETVTELFENADPTPDSYDSVSALVEQLETRTQEVRSLRDSVEQKDSKIEQLNMRVTKLKSNLREIAQIQAQLESVETELEATLPDSVLSEGGSEETQEANVQQTESELANSPTGSKSSNESPETSDNGEQSESETENKKPSDRTEFIESQKVQHVVQEIASSKSHSLSERYLVAILEEIKEENGEVTYEQVRRSLGVSSTTNISSASVALQSANVIESRRKDGVMAVDVNPDNYDSVEWTTSLD